MSLALAHHEAKKMTLGLRSDLVVQRVPNKASVSHMVGDRERFRPSAPFHLFSRKRRPFFCPPIGTYHGGEYQNPV
jgi:hypothetical protein